MKKILGLDLGTNSVGWALISQNFDEKKGEILGIGSRIIPMSQDIMSEFGRGNSISQTASRTNFRSIRRLRERHLLRRERLHRVLNILGFLPDHYSNQVDFENRLGKFEIDSEPKLAYNESGFLFIDSFNEMVKEFKNYNPILFENDKKIPYDWTIYYLRKKALTQKIQKEELAWIILNFNQKRGYYQLRGEEEEENPNKLVEFHSLKIENVVADEKPNVKGETWYSLILENGWVYRRSSKTPLYDWKDKIRDFIVTTDLNEDGTIKTDKDGIEKRSFRAPKEDDWNLVKKKTEQEIDNSEMTVGSYIYQTLLKDPSQKIKGKLVRTIERKFYKTELETILKKQKGFHSELEDINFYNDSVRELYKNNDSRRILLSKKDFVHLFLEDIIFYQRPLKSKKSTIGNCPLEFRTYEHGGIEVKKHLKSIPKSNPYYQEFRLWQWIKNLVILKKDDESEFNSKILKNIEDYERLFEFLNNKKEIDQKSLLKFFKLNDKEFRWNYVEDKKYPCNETFALIQSRLSKVEDLQKDFLTDNILHQIWHIIYSVKDKNEYEKALKTFAGKNRIDKNSFFEAFKKFPPFKNDYGSYSEKAIKKLLPIMRVGKYWNWDFIDELSKKRIEKIITGEFDEEIKIKVREKAFHLTEEIHFQGLPLWLSSYIVYGRHSEPSNAGKWNSIEDLENYLEDFKQHSLRNPIVEQVITETLRVVKDIWQKYGKGQKDFFNEIHIELGRDLKNTSEERKRLTNIVVENENTNLRIKSLLIELLNDSEFENIRPFSPSQQEILKIYEDGILNSGLEVPEEIAKISKKAEPSRAELQKYKLWLEQKYRSPYTGQVIPMSKLFTSEYEIEHIIPQSRYFDDSFSNKVICESAVNKLKDNQTALEFIKNHHGEVIPVGFGKSVKVFDELEFTEFVKENYSKNRSKRNKLMLEEIPDKMIERQLNDTRYISKYLTSLLSNIVRSDKDDDGFNSKNVIPCNGKITAELRQDWGLNDIWNELIFPRFERMNELTKSDLFTSYSEKHQKHLPSVPLEYSVGFQKKRIDHRHHALDALVIACATRNHVNLLNNKHAKSDIRFDLNRKLKIYEKVKYKHPKTGILIEREVPKIFQKPWASFTHNAKTELEKIVVSFKQNLRVINKATNKFEKWVDKNGINTKETIKQSVVNWAIRKPLHKDTVSGIVKLKKIKTVSLNTALENYQDLVDKDLKKKIISLVKLRYDKKLLLKFFKDRNYKWENKEVSKVGIYYMEEDNVASRVSLDSSFNVKKIESITDHGIQKILLNHLEKYKGVLDEKGNEISPETLAFSPEGIEEMNNSISELNGGKFHHPILKVRTYEPKGNKFQVGQSGNKSKKYVEAAKGTNLFFAIYQNSEGKRSFETIPFNVVVERQKQGLSPVPEINEKGDKILFHLSPNDLVYIIHNEENSITVSPGEIMESTAQIQNIYKIVSFTGNRLYGIPFSVSSPIVDKVEFSLLNKLEFSDKKISIKENCIKLKVDRLGEILR
ncbi:type II CRISPR RNA-guided endonuclease Cas9 [Aquiflexum sp. LQ15W]|uniref:type II CRISPR RNA-guided endonuclease Cas9 n=1 Tax=Cognataquiflexum nitidum TaxID=2922272 RepID=UPI001F139FC4|nr:type II CRISPR RNA-guided endonuclease Cas9 [Cognataquiflexum nitidum]MCH6200036.1 type II CRISPR RNA-guided endonuclease Cas9 [Cognataquiflexum nitidum]